LTERMTGYARPPSELKSEPGGTRTTWVSCWVIKVIE
jgi:hypothetical protein